MTDYAIIETPARNTLGEGPIWVARLNSLFWVDIVEQRVWSLSLDDGATSSWPMPERIGWLAERSGRLDFLAGFKSGVVELSLDPLSIEPLIAPEPDRPHNRLNDAKVDPAGRLWFGSKDDRDQEAIGALYRLDVDARLTRQDDGYQVTNGPTFSPDGMVLYHNDSGRRLVYRFDLAPDGAISDRSVLIRFEDDWGYPDGMTTDAEGCLWVAHWGGGRISRFDPCGRLMIAIRLPASNITSCAFAGEALDRLYVTSASLGATGEQHAGALFEVSVGVKGLAPVPYAG